MIKLSKKAKPQHLRLANESSIILDLLLVHVVSVYSLTYLFVLESNNFQNVWQQMIRPYTIMAQICISMDNCLQQEVHCTIYGSILVLLTSPYTFTSLKGTLHA